MDSPGPCRTKTPLPLFVPSRKNSQSNQEADSTTGKCVRSSGGDGTKKVEHCFRWHDSAACRNGGRSGFCIRGWTEKCIMCSQGKQVDKVPGECVRNEMLLAEA